MIQSGFLLNVAITWISVTYSYRYTFNFGRIVYKLIFEQMMQWGIVHTGGEILKEAVDDLNLGNVGTF